MSEHFDCPHCGQDLRLGPNAYTELIRLQAALAKSKRVNNPHMNSSEGK